MSQHGPERTDDQQEKNEASIEGMAVSCHSGGVGWRRKENESLELRRS